MASAVAQANADVSSSREIRLPEPVWRARQRSHLERIRRWSGPARERASRGEKHPIYDFLLEYYSWRPGLIERWHPGVNVILEGEGARKFLTIKGYHETPEGDGVYCSSAALPQRRLDSVRWIMGLLETCRDRAPFFGCFGMHEWAMVYKTEDIRHSTTPLRFPPERIAEIVDAIGIRCSHFDAFRFFTEAARPLNVVQPTAADRLLNEQRACVHVTMDLYKWAIKLAPFVPGDLTADAFELAIAARELDMRASPYDVRHLGFEPVCIETPEGRTEYEREQRALAKRSEPIRGRLIEVCRQVLAGSPS